MPTVEVFNGNLEDALAVFKRKTGEERVMGEFKQKQSYIPPHEQKARKAFRAQCRRKQRERRRK